MKYRVATHFIDHDQTPYYTGELYPYLDKEVPKEHIEYLTSNKNKLGRPVIIVPEREVTENEKPVRRRKASKNEAGNNE